MLKCEQREARFTIFTPGDRPSFIIHYKVQGSAPGAEHNLDFPNKSKSMVLVL